MTDDFDGEYLGGNWRYSGVSMQSARLPLVNQSVSAKILGSVTDGAEGFRVYGSMPAGDGSQVGAVLRHDTTCINCGKRPAAGDVLTADLAPNMAGTWHHTDCDDPKLERDVPGVC